MRWSLHKRNLFVGSSITITIVIASIYTIYALMLSKRITIPLLFPEKKIEQTVDISCANFKNDAPHIVESITLNKKWALIGNEFKDSDKTIKISGNLSELINKYVNAQDPLKVTYRLNGIDNAYSGQYISDTKEYSVELNYNKFKPDKYQSILTFETPCGLIEKDIPEITVTYPVYVAWTLDYEGYDISNEYLNDIADLANKYQIPLTHFYNPRIYTSPYLSDARKDYLTTWIKTRSEQNHDVIGLHLHMFPDMVKAAGVEPHKDAKTWGGSNTDGYNILVLGYNYEEMTKIINWSKGLFTEKGIPTPTIFRAGGWFADSETLRAVQDSGFIADSSGRDKYMVQGGNVWGPWDLLSTTQPYHPNTTNQNSAETPNLTIWEFPNNGNDSWAYSADDLIARLQANYNPDKVEESKVLVTYISHPEWYYADKPKMEKVYGYASKFMYKNDEGPVIFITLQDADNIWNQGK